MSPSRHDRIEKAFESLIFASRWLQAPMYFGLLLAGFGYLYKFFAELWELGSGLFMKSETEILIAILTLVDIVLVMNLVVMIIVGGYETFVSRLAIKGHADYPAWLEHIDGGMLKVKVLASLVSITGIYLLKTFMSVEKEDPDAVRWRIIIHAVFIFANTTMIISEYILHKIYAMKSLQSQKH